ncbi:MAG: hypothetical protein HKL90_00495 [Elusimicrobia bacterium]|nr:hypothetical protein [Elusimicrobiota bacterium]
MKKMESGVFVAFAGLVVCLALEPGTAQSQENSACRVPDFSNATIMTRSGHDDGISPALYFEIETNDQAPRTIAISLKQEDGAGGRRLKRYYLAGNSLIATMNGAVQENSGTLTDEVFDCAGQKIGTVSKTADAVFHIRNANGELVATSSPSNGFLWARDNRLELNDSDGNVAAILSTNGGFSNSAGFSVRNSRTIDPRLALDFAILGLEAQGQKIPRL